MKRLLSILLAFSMIFLCAVPSSAESITFLDEDDYLYVEYEEFYSNQAYYNTL